MIFRHQNAIGIHFINGRKTVRPYGDDACRDYMLGRLLT
jgi:hypothetical protein